MITIRHSYSYSSAQYTLATNGKKWLYYSMCIQRNSLEDHLLFINLATLSSNEILSVLIQVQLCNDDLRWVNVDWDGSTVTLLSGQLFELNNKLQSVDRRDSTFLALLGTSDDENFVVLSDWKSLHSVFFN